MYVQSVYPTMNTAQINYRFGIFFLLATLSGCSASDGPPADNNNSSNSAPTANAGPDQNVATGQSVQLDGSGSNDANNDPLTYSWLFTARPANSNVSLDNDSVSNPIFVPDMDGTYTLSLLVNDSLLDSTVDTVNILSSSNPNPVSDNFSGNGELIGYTTNNPDSLPDVTRTDGRYRANLVNNDNDITLHFNDLQGRLDAKLVDFPFNYIASATV